MNKLLLGYFYSIALSLAGNLRPAPELIDRARGYYNHKQVQVKIRSEDGIDRAEAFTLAEQDILGAIYYSRVPVQRYDRPKKDGYFWRINVFIKTSTGLKSQPLLVDSITGERHGVPYGDSWYNVSGYSVDLGSSKYLIKRNRDANSLSVEVTLNRMTESKDLTARKECYRDAVRAIAKIKQNFPAKFEDVPLRAIVMSEASMSDTYSRLDRRWYAKFPLIQKRSIKPLR